MAETFSIVELFAGVGGFRVGLEATEGWKVVYSNQWEPGRKKQWASDCYQTHFKDGIHTNVDIATVSTEDIPNHTLLVGGFPCQDYSVAATLAQGIQGKRCFMVGNKSHYRSEAPTLCIVRKRRPPDQVSCKTTWS